jgi:hypothetical protein
MATRQGDLVLKMFGPEAGEVMAVVQIPRS